MMVHAAKLVSMPPEVRFVEVLRISLTEGWVFSVEV